MGKLLILILLACVTSVLGRAQTGTPDGNSQCAQWCAAHFPKAGAHCASLAAQGEGPCYDCGPLKPSTSSEQLCSGTCTDTNTDNKNCGCCGTVCPAGSTCTSGVCRLACGIPGCLNGFITFHFDEVQNVSLQQCLAQCSTTTVTDGGQCVTVQYVPADELCTLLDVALPEIRDPVSPPDICGGYFFYDVHCGI